MFLLNFHFLPIGQILRFLLRITSIFNKTISFRWLKTILNEFLWWFMLGRVLVIVIKSWYLISATKLLCGHTVLWDIMTFTKKIYVFFIYWPISTNDGSKYWVNWTLECVWSNFGLNSPPTLLDPPLTEGVFMDN